MLSDRQSLLFDDRDGEVYGIALIGDQEWMAENLRFRCEGSVACDGGEALVSTYGRLYSWSALEAAIPEGWHLPSMLEWEELLWNAGALELERMNSDLKYGGAATSLKSANLWLPDPDFPSVGDDLLHFAAVPSGVRNVSGYSGFGTCAEFWSGTFLGECASTFCFYNFSSAVFRSKVRMDRSPFLAIRCVKN